MGIAIDLGTTKLAGILIDLASGKEICSAGMVNPQIPYGEDIISRLNFALQQKNGTRILAGSLRSALNRLIKNLSSRSGISPEQIVDIAICGNTAMSHLLLELPVEPLARAPYIAGFSTPLELTAGELGLHDVPWAKVLVLPCIGGFVGGDTVAMILACGLDRCSGTTLGIDIGTNTEIVLAKGGAEGEIFVSSCASGPAFEGAHIRDGMRAASGAIEKFQMTPAGPVLSTVNRKAPVGLCGSGLVDAVSELVRLGVIDLRGHLQKNSYLPLRQSQNGKACVLVPEGKSGNGRDIVLTQRDISEIQLAKGAIQAGIQTLLAKTETRIGDIKEVYLAGAFGFYLNIESAVAIGLFPALPKTRFIQAGNAAIGGACLTLMSDKERKRAAAIANKAQHIETAKDSKFKRRFAQALRLEKRR